MRPGCASWYIDAETDEAFLVALIPAPLKPNDEAELELIHSDKYLLAAPELKDVLESPFDAAALLAIPFRRSGEDGF